jgi:hypothetical protein
MCGQIFTDVSAALTTMGMRHGQQPFTGDWSDKHWMNMPGPIYCGETDNCGTGPLSAPNNVHVDAEGHEFIFRQPTNLYEIRQVLLAAEVDLFAGYGADGNLHWTYEEIKEWWGRKRELESEITKLYEEQIALNDRKDYAYFAGLSRWRDFIEDGVGTYLRVYAFFLAEGRIPAIGDHLPTL